MFIEGVSVDMQHSKWRLLLQHRPRELQAWNEALAKDVGIRVGRMLFAAVRKEAMRWPSTDRSDARPRAYARCVCVCVCVFVCGTLGITGIPLVFQAGGPGSCELSLDQRRRTHNW